ncbi:MULTISPECIES: DUF3168 domain-containing protein [unclassified Acidovorax]|uniref:tail completion protein gp17 n=1 Tax=unclassified Acidovorax TaxID=2684926 RepID=UPI001C468B19|nr:MULTISPECIES: DUF3168 domain-containing protein [unclassified Acidovorax]MBV7427278.1 DUF3168 domain-containing protein [Acidovorax sp. sif0732]MBV7448402.1 DUF3168 domain-containing protein [Acidovorax sp. sif0715]
MVDPGADLLIAEALLQAPGITALVGDRCALKQLPQGTGLPALVYQVITSNDNPYLDDESGVSVLRLQINPLAPDMPTVNLIHQAVADALMPVRDQVVAGKRVISVQSDGRAGVDQDQLTGAWTRPADYLVKFDQ